MPGMKRIFVGLLVLAPAWAAAQGVLGQLPGPVQGVGRARLPVDLDALRPSRVLEPLSDRAADLLSRTDALAERLRVDSRIWMPDRNGHPVLRDRLTWLAPSEQARARAQAAGWRLVEALDLEGLGLSVWRVQPPPGLDAVVAQAQLAAFETAGAPEDAPVATAPPQGAAELEHLYVPAGSEAAGPLVGAAGSSAPGAGAARVGLIDTGVDARHPALAAVPIAALGCAPRAHAHGTAVASVISGDADGLRSAAPRLALAAVDVDCGEPGGGSASRLVLGLEALLRARVPVVNISLVGPPNQLVAAAVAAAQARGMLLVAAAGNDGPAAAPLYPAAYPGVIAVAATDVRRRALPESARGDHIGASAVGSAVPVAQVGGGLAQARGTSFAAPWVAGRLALLWGDAPPSVARAQQLRAALAQQLEDLGAPGRDPVFGWGWAGPRWSPKLK